MGWWVMLPDYWERFGPVWRLWPAGDRVSPDEHTVRHGVRLGTLSLGQFTNCRNQASNCRAFQREQPSRSAMRCWLRPERFQRRARSRSVSRIQASRRTGMSSRARAHARRQVVVMVGNAEGGYRPGGSARAWRRNGCGRYGSHGHGPALVPGRRTQHCISGGMASARVSGPRAGSLRPAHPTTRLPNLLTSVVIFESPAPPPHARTRHTAGGGPSLYCRLVQTPRSSRRPRDHCSTARIRP